MDLASPNSASFGTNKTLMTGQMAMPGNLLIDGFEGPMQMSDYSFLIENKTNGKRVLYDLGIRKITESVRDYPERLKKMFDVWPTKADSPPQDMLKAAGIPINTIDSVIFSHLHFDHIGNISDLPKSIDIKLGPYTDTSKVEDLSKLSGSLVVSQETLQGRTISHLTHSRQWQDIGSFRGVDFFGDSSLFLLDTPGHMESHIAALVCTAIEPKPVYHLLAGDAAHHIDLIDYNSPASIAVYPSKLNMMSPFYRSDPERLLCLEEDIGSSYETMAKLARMDHEDNINVFLSHDSSMDNVLREMKGSLDGIIRLDGSYTELKYLKNRSREDILQANDRNIQ